VPEIIDPVFAETSQNAHFLLSENERFGLVFVKTGSINSGTRFNPRNPSTESDLSGGRSRSGGKTTKLFVESGSKNR